MFPCTRLGSGIGTRVDVVEETDRVMPFQRHAFEREPPLVGLGVGFNE